MTVPQDLIERDWSRWTANADGTLGVRGEVYSSACPHQRNQCDDCPAFMGHRKEAPAYVGDAVRFCCAEILSALQSSEQSK